MTPLPPTSAEPSPDSYLLRLWATGQEHLAQRRYVSARTELESAEALAWRRQNPAALARIYLPLLETRRQIRLAACEGPLFIAADVPVTRQHRLLHDFLRHDSGTLLLSGPHAARLAGAVQLAARRRHACLESLLLLRHGGQTRLGSPAHPLFADGLPVRFTANPKDLINPDLSPTLEVPLPRPGLYLPGDPLHAPLHALARESLLVAWEALALHWQSRHPVRPDPWEEIAWLRLALRIDPACEPVTLRLIALAEDLARTPAPTSPATPQAHR